LRWVDEPGHCLGRRCFNFRFCASPAGISRALHATARILMRQPQVPLTDICSAACETSSRHDGERHYPYRPVIATRLRTIGTAAVGKSNAHQLVVYRRGSSRRHDRSTGRRSGARVASGAESVVHDGLCAQCDLAPWAAGQGRQLITGRFLARACVTASKPDASMISLGSLKARE
jgi:hypothetical protein